MDIEDNIQIINIDNILPYHNNPKEHPDHQVNKLASSIKNYGFNQPIVIDKDNEIIAGHGRYKAAKKLGLSKLPVIKKDDLNQAQVKAFRIADNKIAESEWDYEALSIEFEELEFEDYDLDMTGFEEEELEEIWNSIGPDLENEIEEDNFDPEVDKEKDAITKLGDVIQLGKHRLICGDSTSKKDVNKLMNDTKADMCFTDPPYNVNYGTIKHEKFKVRNIKNDNMSAQDFKEFCSNFIDRIVENVRGCVYISGPPGEDGRILFGTADNKMHCSTTIVWNKDQFTLGRGKYQSKYEPIWFGWVETGKEFIQDRTLANVWDIPRPKASELHPTMKPIEVIGTALKHNPRSEIVLDLFGGSGSTLIACEQLDRICYMMELDKHYCDVIIRRYINYRLDNGQEIKMKVNDERMDYKKYLKK